MQRILTVAAAALLFPGIALADDSKISDEMVIDLVEKTAENIQEDAPATFEKIAAGEDPYRNADNPALYVFVYDTDVNMIAHPKSSLIGKNYRGKPDVRGKKFRDAIVDGALADGSGWEDYMYQKPGEKGIHAKTAYYMLVTGSDGAEYVVVSGKYKD